MRHWRFDLRHSHDVNRWRSPQAKPVPVMVWPANLYPTVDRSPLTMAVVFADYPLSTRAMLKSTTRHVLIYAAEVVNDELVPSESVLTLDIDPDNEFTWSDEALKQVNEEFERLVAASAGADLTDYNLRRIGSDLEHFIKQHLQAGDICYILNSRVLNYSMGLPQVVADTQTEA